VSSAPPLGQHDVFRDVTTWDAGQAEEWVAALALRAAAEDQAAMRQRILGRLGLKPGATVVEIGCGLGRLLGDCAEVVAPGGRLIGVEPQPVFARHARQYLEGLTRLCKVEVREASADALGVADGVADACLAQTVLVHLPEATLRGALSEMVRVTRPGGTVMSVDQDGDTWVIDHPDRETTRAIVRFNSDQRFADGWTGRRLRRLFAEAGLVDPAVEVWPHADTERSSYLFGSCIRLAGAAAQVGAITLGQLGSWVEELEARAARGQFFSAISYFAVTGRRP